MIFATRFQASGRHRCSQASLVTVKAATGTLPTALAHAAGPPSRTLRFSASGADSSVVPQLGGVYGSGVLVESNHAVLLSGHADGRNCWRAGLYPRRVERRPPAFGVLFTHRRDDVWMRSGRRGNHLPRCKISDFDLRRLGGRVNSGDEGHVTESTGQI